MYHDMARMAGIAPMSSTQMILAQIVSLLAMGLVFWVASRFSREMRLWTLMECLAFPTYIALGTISAMWLLLLVPVIGWAWALVFAYNQIIDPNFSINLCRAWFSAMICFSLMVALNWMVESTTKLFRRPPPLLA